MLTVRGSVPFPAATNVDGFSGSVTCYHMTDLVRACDGGVLQPSPPLSCGEMT